MKTKLLILSGIVLAFSSCSNDILTGGGEVNDPTTSGGTGLATASYTVGGGDQTRAANFAYTGYKTRGISDFVMPEQPTEEEITSSNPTELNSFDSNKNSFIVTNSYEGWVNAPNQPSVLYVKGSFKGAFSGGNWTIYILDGGSFEYIGENIGTGISIYNWGEFTTTGNFSLNNSLLYSVADVNVNGTLTFPKGAQYYCKEATYAKRISVNGEAKVESCSFIIGDENDSNSASPDTWGNIPWDATGVINFEGGNLYFCTSYIKAGYIKFNSNNNLHLTLENNGRIDTKYLQVDPKQNDQKIVTLGSSAVVCASQIFLQQNFQQNEEKLLPNFGVGVHLQDVEVIHENGNDNEPADYDIPTDGGINNPDFSMEAGNCSPGYGDQSPEPTPSLDLVTNVKSMTHDHDEDKPGEVGDKPRRHLSATSLTFDGGNIYASYHMRGGNWGGDTYDKDDIEGCIERWTFDGNEVNIGNWMWTNEFDFNHIILDLDEDQIVTVGHKGGEKKVKGDNGQEYTDFGGIIGKLPIDFYKRNWDAKDELKREDFEYKYLTTEEPIYETKEYKNGTIQDEILDYKNAGDGNCVVKVGNNYFVATSAGYGVIDSNFKRIKDGNGDVLFTPTDGSAKYLVVNDGTVNVLYLDDRATNGSEETTSFSATLATLNTDTYPKEATEQAMQNNVSPVDGKNVIAVDDNGTVYACLSKGGLQIGNEVVALEGEDGIRSVNGVAVDEKYIYVANGSYITVLDKTTHEVVVERKGNTQYVSANFVEVKEYNGETYVFVAFGQDGIKVYKFTNN